MNALSVYFEKRLNPLFQKVRLFVTTLVAATAPCFLNACTGSSPPVPAQTSPDSGGIESNSTNDNHQDGRQGTMDLAADQPENCEIHRTKMDPKTVDLLFGMKRRLARIDQARPKLFPHADEPYDTGWCIPPRERTARISVCSDCTTAKKDWLMENAHKTE